jgi:hypothetical protein
MISCATVSFSSTSHNVVRLKTYLAKDFCSSSSSASYFSGIHESCSNRTCQSFYVLPKFLLLSFLSSFNFMLSYCVTSFVNIWFHLLTVYLLGVLLLVPLRLFMALVIYIDFLLQRRSPLTCCCLSVPPCSLEQCFSTAGPRPGTGPWHQLYRTARGKYFIVEIF